GWAVAHTLLFHERNQTAGVGYGYLGGRRRPQRPEAATAPPIGPAELAARPAPGHREDLHAQTVADAWVDALVGDLTSARIMRGMSLGTHTGPWGSLAQL